MAVSYLNPSVVPTTLPGNARSAVAHSPIAAGAVIAAFGGRCVTRAEFDELGVDQRGVDQQRRSIQIEDDLYMAGAPTAEDADFVQHSCEPNCGMRGSVMVVAMRDIALGEALTYDYAMCDGSDYDEFECTCGAPTCRGKVTGQDWMLPALQLRYRGFFSPYLARRISDLVTVGAERRAFAL